MAKVLVVDDSASVRSRVAKYVLGLGHEVEEAEDGEKAVAKFDEWSPDLVLLDITMPIMGGMEALRLIRKHDANATVVMVTAVADQRTVMEALRDGASDFVPKPLTPEKITRAVASLSA